MDNWNSRDWNDLLYACIGCPHEPDSDVEWGWD